jgi:hypothetical protein
MAIATDLHTRPLTESLDPATLRLIDTDIHNDLPSLQELRPFLAREWHPYLDNGGPKFAARYYANTGSGRMDGRRARGGRALRGRPPTGRSGS